VLEVDRGIAVPVDDQATVLTAEHPRRLGSVGFTARQVEHVFEEGNQRSATTSRPPFQRVL
jgi:hypothetical protein